MRLPRLRDRRERVPLTQRELAKKAGVSPQTIIAIEQGGHALPSTIRKLAQALDVDPQELMPPTAD